MTNDNPETSLPGPCSQQEDQALFVDIKAADWLGERNGWHTDGLDLQQESSGSRLLDDIRAMDAVNMVRSRCRTEADEPLDRMAAPIFLKWVKGVGWVRSGTPVVAPPKGVRVGLTAERQRPRSDGTYPKSIKTFSVSTTAYARWMRPQGRAPPFCKVNR